MRRIAAGSLLGVIVVSSVAAIVLLALSVSTPLPETHGPRGMMIIFAFISGGVGLAITLRQPRNGVGWIFLLAATGSALYEVAEGYTAYAIFVRHGELPAGEWPAWVGSWLWLPTTAVIPTFLFLVFPDGRLPSPRWRPVVWYGALALSLFTSSVALAPGPLYGAPSVRNPVTPFTEGSAPDVPIALLFFMLLPAVVLAVVSLIRRFRGASGGERLQLKWIAYASVLYVVGVFLDSNFKHPVYQLVDSSASAPSR